VFDGGDCCPSTCVDGSYSCDSYGGDCDDCVAYEDPACVEPPTCAELGGLEDCSGDGDCAPASWLGDGWCDGEDQPYGYDLTCYDNDNGDCDVASCEDQGLVDCGDGQCIPDSWNCDGWSDCANGADEADCAPLSCEDQGLFDCGDGQCIPTSYVCDGSSEFCNAGWGPDCANGADEGLDACGYTDDCVPDDPCADAPYPSWAGDGYCDGSNNYDGCFDGGDCCESTCVDGSYSCDSYGGCNGDCLDPAGNDDACAPPECAEGQFDCLGDGTECIPGSWVCDISWVDCSNGADEADCAPESCEDQGLADCGDGQCVYDSWFCDGWADCANGGDEADCAPASCEDQGLFDCGDGQCIPTSYVCDGSSEFCNAGWPADCANGADEGLDACGYTDDCTSVLAINYDFAQDIAGLQFLLHLHQIGNLQCLVQNHN
jgi:hypothetical protein